MADKFSFTPANYQPFQTATGYGYDDWLAQVRDSLSTPTRGAGIFGELGGNNMPRYAFGNRDAQKHPGSGFNASQFLAPYLAAIQPPGGGPPQGIPGGPGAPPPSAPPPGGGLLGSGPGGARVLAPGYAPGTQPGTPMAGPLPPNGGARGLLAPGYGPREPVNPTGMRTAIPAAGSAPMMGGARGLLGNGSAQSPMQQFLAQLLAQQNMSGPGGVRGSR